TPSHPFAGFGANEWLVEEMYQQYLKDASSVDKAWWDFFSDYASGETSRDQSSAPAASSPAIPGPAIPGPATPGPATPAPATAAPASAAPSAAGVDNAAEK